MKFPTHLPPPKVKDTLELRLEFSIKGKGRPRFDSRSGHAYMPKAYVLNKKSVTLLLQQLVIYKPGFMDSVSLFVCEIVLYRKRRKPKSKADLALMERTMPFGGLCTGKPDADNALGTLMDAANSVVYVDDQQVAIALVERRWAEDDGAFIRLRKLAGYGEEG